MTATERVALIAGVTGIAGVSLAEMLCQGQPGWDSVYGIARRPRPPWLGHVSSLRYIQCDLLNESESQAAFAPFAARVTHLFFVTWANRDTEQENIRVNVSLLRNTLDALLPHGRLQHVCLLTGTKHYLGSSFSWSAAHEGQHSMRTFAEDTPRLKETIFYYAQEDVLADVAAQSAGQVTWSVHRAGIIQGWSPRALVSSVLGIATYACICQHTNAPFVFPWLRRAWESHVECTDAELIAEQQIWVVNSTDPACRNQAYNVANGDTMAWKDMWAAIAKSFGLEVPPYTPGEEDVSLVSMMRDKRHVWEGIVSTYGLHPTTWEHLMFNWTYIDDARNLLPPYRMSMAKSASLGFLGARDTRASFLSAIDKMRARGVLPPVDDSHRYPKHFSDPEPCFRRAVLDFPLYTEG